MQKEIDRYIKLSLEGDRDAFASLFNEYGSSVKQMLISLSGNDFDSNDLMQETFIKAFLNLDKYNKNYTFRCWLLSIAKNTFIDYVRRRSAQSYKSMLNYNDINDIIDDDIDVIETDVKELVAIQIENLPPKYRKIVELRYYIGYDYSTISQILNIPEGTVKTHLYRAKSRLKEEIIKYINSEVSR